MRRQANGPPRSIERSNSGHEQLEPIQSVCHALFGNASNKFTEMVLTGCWYPPSPEEYLAAKAAAQRKAARTAAHSLGAPIFSRSDRPPFCWRSDRPWCGPSGAFGCKDDPDEASGRGGFLRALLNIGSTLLTKRQTLNALNPVWQHQQVHGTLRRPPPLCAPSRSAPWAFSGPSSSA